MEMSRVAFPVVVASAGDGGRPCHCVRVWAL